LRTLQNKGCVHPQLIRFIPSAPGSIGSAYTYSGPLSKAEDLNTTSGDFSSNPFLSQSRAEQLLCISPKKGLNILTAQNLKGMSYLGQIKYLFLYGFLGGLCCLLL
jgi:hypothetical protein